MAKNFGQNKKIGGVLASTGDTRTTTGAARVISDKKLGSIAARIAGHPARTGVIRAKVKRVSEDGVVVVVDGRQRAHAFDAEEIQVRRASKDSSPIAVGETVTIRSEGKILKVTLD